MTEKFPELMKDRKEFTNTESMTYAKKDEFEEIHIQTQFNKTAEQLRTTN